MRAEGAPPKTAFWFLCRRGQRNPPPGRRNPPFHVLSSNGKNQWPRPPSLAPSGQFTLRSPGAGLRGVPALQSPAPGPPLRGTLALGDSANPARAVQLIAPASPPLPLAGFWDESRAGWTKKARLVHAAVGAGSDGRMGTSAPTQEAETEKRGRDRNGHSHVLCSERAQKRSGASHKVLCQAFFQESGASQEAFLVPFFSKKGT